MAGAASRTAEENGAEMAMFPLGPTTEEEAQNKEMEEAWKYFQKSLINRIYVEKEVKNNMLKS